MRNWLKAGAVASLYALTAACGGPTDTGVEAPAEEGGAAPSAQIAPGEGAITAEGLRRHIAKLASDEFAGRAPGTPGGELARNYIADEYKRLGLKPVNGSYFQDVPMVEATVDPDVSYLRFDGPDGATELEYRKDAVYWTKRVEDDVSFDDSDVVFVGYGVVAPEYQWDDYAGVDVKGKTVIILVNDPGFATEDPQLFNGRAMTYYGRWTYKYEEAARQGAAGALIIHDEAPAAYGWGVVEGSWSGPQLDLQRADGGATRAAAEGWLSNSAARALLSSAGLDLDELMEAAKTREFKPAPLQGVTASARIKSDIRLSVDANVLGILEGSEKPQEYVLYMGHWDHLGAESVEEGEDGIYNGAVDNATGIAAIIEVAEKFASNTERPKRSILFAAVTGEESGLLGSAYMAESPPVPLKDIVGGINIDAILPSPLAKDMIVVGSGASELEDILKEKAAAHNRYLRPDAEPEKGYFYRSDHISLAKKGVPMLYADQGIDFVDGGEEAGEAFSRDYTVNRYHAPTDELDESWDFDGMVDTVEILYETGSELAYSDIWPNWYEGNEFRALRDAQRAGD